jgi:hypothetical protein
MDVKAARAEKPILDGQIFIIRGRQFHSTKKGKRLFLNGCASTGLISAAKGVLKLVPRWDKRIKCLGNVLKNKDAIFGLETPGKF